MKQKKLIGGAMKYEGATLSSSQRLIIAMKLIISLSESRHTIKFFFTFLMIIINKDILKDIFVFNYLLYKLSEFGFDSHAETFSL
jgi:hypothetical protein